MFCPNCGKADQAPDTYCRNCGRFLADISDKFSIARLLGMNTPEKQANTNIVLSLATAVISIILVAFLNGYFDAHEIRTGESAPSIVYLVYVFLGLVAISQFISLIIALNFKSKLNKARKPVESYVAPPAMQNAITSKDLQASLPEANYENVVTANVVEDTTKLFNQTPKK